MCSEHCVPYQLLVVVSAEVPDVNGPTLVPHDEGGLVGMETHTRHRGIHLEQTLTLLGAPPAEEGQSGTGTYIQSNMLHRVLESALKIEFCMIL